MSLIPQIDVQTPSPVSSRVHTREKRTRDKEPIGAAVALGGGGARGLAHLGVMEVIGEAAVRTEQIVGVSIGSLMGGLCAVDTNIKRVQAKAISLLHSPVFSEKCQRLTGTAARLSSGAKSQGAMAWNDAWLFSLYARFEKMMRHGHRLTRMVRSPSVLSNQILNEAIESLIPDIDLSETAIPISIVAADLVSGHRVVLENGSLRKAILASTAIPGFFEPVKWGSMLLCDIGVLDAIPLSIAQSYGKEITVGVDVGSAVQPVQQVGTAIDVVLRMEEIGERVCRRHSFRHADWVIRPEVGHRPWYDFTDPERLIHLGRDAALRTLSRHTHSHKHT